MKNKMKKKKTNKIQFSAGLILVLLGAFFMIFDIFSLSERIIISILGLGLIATSKFRLLK